MKSASLFIALFIAFASLATFSSVTSNAAKNLPEKLQATPISTDWTVRQQSKLLGPQVLYICAAGVRIEIDRSFIVIARTDSKDVLFYNPRTKIYCYSPMSNSHDFFTGRMAAFHGEDLNKQEFKWRIVGHEKRLGLPTTVYVGERTLEQPKVYGQAPQKAIKRVGKAWIYDEMTVAARQLTLLSRLNALPLIPGVKAIPLLATLSEVYPNKTNTSLGVEVKKIQSGKIADGLFRLPDLRNYKKMKSPDDLFINDNKGVIEDMADLLGSDAKTHEKK